MPLVSCEAATLRDVAAAAAAAVLNVEEEPRTVLEQALFAVARSESEPLVPNAAKKPAGAVIVATVVLPEEV